MNKLSLIFILSLFLNFTNSFAQSNDCEVNVLRKANKKMLQHFLYDSQKLTTLSSSHETQTIESEIAVFSKESYRLIFNLTKVKGPVEVTVYDASYTKKKVYSLKSDTGFNDVFFFDPASSSLLIVEYKIKNREATCALLTIGYQNK
jgi:hypothetical protein